MEVKLDPPLTAGPITLDGCLCRVNGRAVALATRQAQLMRILMRAANRPVATRDIRDVMFGHFMVDHNLNLHMRKLRERVEEDSKNPVYLRTILSKGMGHESSNAYMLVTDDELRASLDKLYDSFGRRRK